jgi:aspartyl-tRNA(Asn)/glutamyl-tRNA(Gln) amidotransferase subunit B
MAEYEAVIGLEVHVQLNTKSKLFCSCSTRFGAQANTQVCPVCLGQPGSLPVLNRLAFEKSMRAALALKCQIAAQTKFDRKNYYYPDLPKNYQISQYDMPIALKGQVSFEVKGIEKTVHLTRAHIEEDAGKLLHDSGPGTDKSCVDLNRTGTPLLEIVTDPDISSADEAVGYLTALKQILKYLDVSDCEMQEGSMRCEPNISVRPVGQKELGTKTEVKNLNSFKAVFGAINYEIKRQTKMLEKGQRIRQVTMLWDVDNQRTREMRSKEEAQDYRYFPEPDLPPFTISQQWIDEVKALLPELPRLRCQRFQDVLKIEASLAEVLTAEKPVADYFEAVLAAGAAAGEAAKWVANDCLRQREERNLDFKNFPVAPEEIAAVISLIAEKVINASIARQKLLPAIFEAGGSKGARELLAELKLAQVTDSGAISGAVDAVLKKNPQAIEDFAKGKTTVLTFLIGQVMRETRGKANAGVVRELLEQKLKELS